MMELTFILFKKLFFLNTNQYQRQGNKKEEILVEKVVEGLLVSQIYKTHVIKRIFNT